MQGPPSAAASAGSSQSHAASDARCASQASTSSCVSHVCCSAPAAAISPDREASSTTVQPTGLYPGVVDSVVLILAAAHFRCGRSGCVDVEGTRQAGAMGAAESHAKDTASPRLMRAGMGPPDTWVCGSEGCCSAEESWRVVGTDGAAHGAAATRDGNQNVVVGSLAGNETRERVTMPSLASTSPSRLRRAARDGLSSVSPGQRFPKTGVSPRRRGAPRTPSSQKGSAGNMTPRKSAQHDQECLLPSGFHMVETSVSKPTQSPRRTVSSGSPRTTSASRTPSEGGSLGSRKSEAAFRVHRLSLTGTARALTEREAERLRLDLLECISDGSTDPQLVLAVAHKCGIILDHEKKGGGIVAAGAGAARTPRMAQLLKSVHNFQHAVDVDNDSVAGPLEHHDPLLRRELDPDDPQNQGILRKESNADVVTSPWSKTA